MPYSGGTSTSDSPPSAERRGDPDRSLPTPPNSKTRTRDRGSNPSCSSASSPPSGSSRLWLGYPIRSTPQNPEPGSGLWTHRSRTSFESRFHETAHMSVSSSRWKVANSTLTRPRPQGLHACETSQQPGPTRNSLRVPSGTEAPHSLPAWMRSAVWQPQGLSTDSQVMPSESVVIHRHQNWQAVRAREWVRPSSVAGSQAASRTTASAGSSCDIGKVT